MLNITNRRAFLNYVLLLVGILVILNIVARSQFFRWDVTDRKNVLLSDASRRVISQLQGRLLAKIYFSGDLPGTYASARRYLQDLLEEYQAYSGGRFRFEFVNPEKDDTAQEQARNYGIQPMQMQAIENDKMEIRNVYMGAVFLYGDKKETLPAIQTTQGLEYSLTATIKKVTAARLKQIGIVSEENDEISTQNLRQFLRQVYDVRTVDLASPIPDDVQAVIMNGRTDSLTREALYHLDQYVMRGGGLLIGQGRVHDMLQQGFAADIRTNMFSFLGHAGVTIGDGLVIDQRCGQVQMQSQQGFFVVRNAIDYPPFPVIQKFNQNHVITKGLASARLFFSSTLEPAKGSQTEFIPLMYTSDKTGVMEGPFYQINPIQNPMMKMFPYPSQVVAALVQGPMSSFFQDSADFAGRTAFVGSVASGRILIVTDNQFFNDHRAAGIPENTDFILNSVDYLAGDEDLIGIRNKDITQRPLTELSEGQRRAIKWANLILPAGLVVGLGVLRWRMNRRRRRMLEAEYGKS